jgi:putative CocE/NonD family hydrolase
MSDGTKLAAKIWMPADAENNPVPAVFEYIPYRKRDFKAIRDHEIHGYFAQNGYAGIRVDLRGSGDSEGILRDEYLQQELDDGLEVLKWIASQPWCDGNIGMIGISWGGFNGLQLAELQPPELKAVISVASSDDRYADDVHYMGGTLLTDNLSWASTMFAFNSCPPDPAVVGEKWREMWLERLEGSGLWLKKWLDHQRRDDYWKHASVCENYAAIKCPVFAVSGWADGYSNTVFRLMENLQAPRKGLIGAWGHKYPHMGGPGPEIDFLNESIRWWDQWLKRIDNGVKEDPVLRVWMQDTISPLSAKRPGHWVAEKEWPPLNSHIKAEKYPLFAGKIAMEPQDCDRQEALSIQSPLNVGLFAGKWCSYSESTDLPSDQREEDGGALVFDSEPLQEDYEILGRPAIALDLTSDKEVATVAVRLSDVGPDGRATRVSYGLLNLTHRHSDEEPEPLEPGKRYYITIPMNYIAQRFPAGNQIRVAISTSYWPLAWPSPEPARITIFIGSTNVVLPRRKIQQEETLRDLGKPGAVPAYPVTLLQPALREWKVEHNLANNEVSLNVVNNDRQYRLEDINWEIGRDVSERYSYMGNNYDTLRGEVKSVRTFRRDSWMAQAITRTVLTSSRTHFIIRATLDAYEGDVRVYSKTFDERIKRDLL